MRVGVGARQLLVILESRKFYRFSNIILGMKTSDYDCEIDGKSLAFYHNQTTHRYEIVIDYDSSNPHVVTKAKGRAIIEFLKALKIAPRDGS